VLRVSVLGVFLAEEAFWRETHSGKVTCPQVKRFLLVTAHSSYF